MKWIGLAAAALLVASCFLPWSVITSQHFTVSGVDAEKIRLGRPGYGHFVLTALFLLFTVTPKLWAKQWNLLVSALNVAWAVRNFFVFSACSMGDCPERQLGLWGILVTTILMLVSALFPDMKMPVQKKN